MDNHRCIVQIKQLQHNTIFFIGSSLGGVPSDDYTVYIIQPFKTRLAQQQWMRSIAYTVFDLAYSG
jgi:hypothetical protein